MSLNMDVKFRVISFTKLVSGDTLTLDKLRSAAAEDGFFYLDLTDVSNFGILQDVSDLVSVSETLFDLPISEKILYDTNKIGTLRNYGYKPIGRNTGLADKRDGHELFLLPRDAIFGIDGHDQLKAPSVIFDKIEMLKRFAEESHRICLTILKALEQPSGIESFVNCHRPDRASTSALAFLRYPPLGTDTDLAGHIAHTDVGSLTLLFSEQAGLQAIHPSSGTWEDVTPRPGHAVVNIGDSLHHLSKRTLKSALHRALPNTKPSADARYSVIYFMRPEQTATFFDESEREWTSINWHVRKFDAFRADKSSDVQHILDGRVSM